MYTLPEQQGERESCCWVVVVVVVSLSEVINEIGDTYTLSAM